MKNIISYCLNANRFLFFDIMILSETKEFVHVISVQDS